MASIPGSTATGSENRDEAWVAVKRTIDGATFRSIEVFEAAFEGPNAEAFDSQAAFDAEVLARQREAFYVDCGMSYQGPPTQTLSGLGHLEGETEPLARQRVEKGKSVSVRVTRGGRR